MSDMRQYKIGLLGCGTVGRGLVELVHRNRSLIRERSGVDLTFTRILVRNLDRERPGVDRSLLTIYPEKVINNGCDIVVELVGGLEPARGFIRSALAQRKHVVTANKALLAVDGSKLMTAAAKQGVQFGFEASVCAGIPIIHALQNGLVGNKINSITGILNGTCNYILTRMEDGLNFAHALREAQQKGFAESDPSLDIDGDDAAQKLKILSELAFGGNICSGSVHTRGIRDITVDDVLNARKFGYVIKHVAIAEAQERGVTLRVHPAFVPQTHQLAAVRDENNAVLVKADAAGDMFFYGKGAGSLPSASAVLSDIVEIATQRKADVRVPTRCLDTLQSKHDGRSYLRFAVNQPNAASSIATMLQSNGVSVIDTSSSVDNGRELRHVGIFTHACASNTLQSALHKIADLGLLLGVPVVMPVAC